MSCTGAIAGVIAGLILASSEPIVIGTDAKPSESYIYIDDAGAMVGFEKELMDEICTRAELDCSWKTANFDQLIPGVMSGEFDVVIGGIAVTEERRKLVDFTEPYFVDGQDEWYIGRPGAPEPAAALVAVQSGTMHESHLRHLGYRFISFRTEPEVLTALADGEADLALGPFGDAEQMASYFSATGVDYLYSDIIPHEGQAIAVCRGNTELLGALNTAYTSIVADGTFDALETRWFE
ncbi:substrate-binding periplasmic protein [Tabrizicola sp.]|uniref:substrate-binding periplasmic protein n=1 Tax=Tabrizicola sp. TaxID=2005166 RepID=UPI003F404500